VVTSKKEWAVQLGEYHEVACLALVSMNRCRVRLFTLCRLRKKKKMITSKYQNNSTNLHTVTALIVQQINKTTNKKQKNFCVAKDVAW
jgi:hypothetical protein